jgi:multisubunit Na+/H+ antiporter MnhE subunit
MNMHQLTPYNLTLIELRLVGLGFAILVIIALTLIELVPKRLHIVRIGSYILLIINGSALMYCLIIFQGTVK